MRTKTIVMPVFIALMGLGMVSCAHMREMCGHGSKGKSAGSMTVCAKCGVPNGKCKCGMGTAQLPEVGTAALKTLIDSGVPMTIVDARTGKFDDGRRIPGAVSLSPEASEQDIQKVLNSKETLVVSYCANLKCPASRMLALRLLGLGYKHVLEYSQGIEGWTEAGYLATPAAK